MLLSLVRGEGEVVLCEDVLSGNFHPPTASKVESSQLVVLLIILAPLTRRTGECRCVPQSSKEGWVLPSYRLVSCISSG
jgi:hypothetical protein